MTKAGKPAAPEGAHDHRQEERRRKPRGKCGSRDIYDLTYRVERRVTHLEESAIEMRNAYAMLSEDVHHLADAGHNHHNDVMAGVNQMNKWAMEHEVQDRKNAHILMFIGFGVFLFFVFVAVKISSL